MLKDVYHNPLDGKDRYPCGAIKSGSRINLSFKIFRHYDIRRANIVIKKDGESEVRYEMKWTGLDGGYDRFGGDVLITSTGLYFYYFEVISPSGVFRVGADGTGRAAWRGAYEWALTSYEREYGLPEWMKSGVIYQIFTDRFNIGGQIIKAKDYARYHEDWFETPVYLPDETGEIMNNDFFGGNLKGVTEKLDYIKSFNVSAIYLNPIFEAYSNHKYDTGDYSAIDPAFGTEKDLEELIAEADKRGIRIILDGVFNHTGSDSVYFNKQKKYKSVGAYQSVNSPYFKWYTFRKFPDKYDSWWGIDTLPSINENDPGFENFINGENGIINKWMKKGIGGFRLDVVDEIPDKFLDNLVSRVKKVKNDAVVIGEVWENAATKTAYGERRRYLQGRQLDSVMNYPFQKAIISFITQGDAQRITEAVTSVVSSYPKEVTDSLMNILSTHDTERAITQLAGEESYRLTKNEKAVTFIPEEKKELAVKKLMLAGLLLYTLPGIPCVYYGDEAGLEGYGDPFCRRTYPWGRENRELISWYRMLGQLRNYKILQEGGIEIEHYDTGGIVFSRNYGNERMYIAANSGNTETEYAVSGRLTDILTGECFENAVIIPPVSARILV